MLFYIMAEISNIILDDCVEVYLRIKKGISFAHLYSFTDNTLICKVAAKGETVNKKYTFTKIFGPDVTQEELFNDVIKSKVLHFINGRNATVFAYGASGSGKTFTMVGTENAPGVIPRAFEYLFRSLPILREDPKAKPLPNGTVMELSALQSEEEKRNTQNLLHIYGQRPDKLLHLKTYRTMQARLSDCPVATITGNADLVEIWVSFAEIYNEHIYDLLQPHSGHSRPKLKLGGLHEHTYIRDLKYYHVKSGLEAYQLLQFGLQNINYAETKVNSHSSRSHAIFTIRLVQGFRAEKCYSSLNFCDLAGSEKLKKTLNTGDRLKESNTINKSLLVLGRCIHQIRSIQQTKDNLLPPFRESKLTQLFQRALSGKEETAMMVTVNPAGTMIDDTHHVLNFSAIAREVEQARKSTFMEYMAKFCSTVVEDDKHQDELRSLRDQVAILTLELSEARLQMEDVCEMERNHLTRQYENIIELKNKQFARLRTRCEQLEQELRDVRQKQNVIVIGDSDEEDYEPCKANEMALKTENLEAIVRQKEDENLALRQRAGRLEADNEMLRKAIQEKDKMLADAVFDFKRLELRCEELEMKNSLYEGSRNETDSSSESCSGDSTDREEATLFVPVRKLPDGDGDDSQSIEEQPTSNSDLKLELPEQLSSFKLS
ncbi:kinesin-like protein subito isoform X2 [Cylas formicarius]|uniref:kinesin-like protein subito isoform X2 n=1 Tax=Cylas formicarius TaxID=197179 RepID=UPI0029583322|nr:kinesin-like protein subito isoform X2 [Cylas formicarius]